MPLHRERFLLDEPLTDNHRPTECQRKPRQQLVEPLGVSDMRFFQAKAARLQTAEQRFAFPSARVLTQRTLSRPWRHHDHIFTGREAHAAEGQLQAPTSARAADDQRRANALRAKQFPHRHRLSPPIRDLCVISHPNPKINSLRAQPTKPLLANKLPVTSQIRNTVAAAQGDQFADDGRALRSVGVTRLRQHRPPQGNRHAFVSNPDDQQVQGRLSQLPVRPVHRQHIWRREWQQSDERQRDDRRGQLEEAEKALNAFVVRVGLGAVREDISNFTQVDGLDLHERDEKLRHKVAARTIERYSLAQRVLQAGRVSHRWVSFPVLFGGKARRG